MPILLDPAQAPALTKLLEDTDTSGLTWHIEQGAASGGVVPCMAGIGAVATAGNHELAFIANPKYQHELTGTQAGAVIVTPAVAQTYRESLAGAQPACTLVVCNNPYLLYARVGQWFERQLWPYPQGFVHPSAVIAPDVELGAGVHVGALAVIESGVRIGARTVIGAGAIIGRGCSIGVDGMVHARVTLCHHVTIGVRVIIHPGAVIGADGFGFAPDSTQVKGAWSKIPQFGGVLIGDDVDIGANTTIDRGALDNTVIGNDVKIDNQIMIGHNVRVGDHTAMAACVGIAGSTTIGMRCSIGGAAMISGHLRIGDDVFISPATAVFSHLEKPGQYTGIFPSTEHSEWERNAVVARRLGKLQQRVKALEK
jgi:UDP-3-O-[3-hydroxymyristoyl] glucosamine N-acyltransferase